MEQEIQVKDEVINVQIEKQLHQEEIKMNTATTAPEYKNAKEKVYDKIPISLKALDIIIVILIFVLVILMAYFIARKYL